MNSNSITYVFDGCIALSTEITESRDSEAQQAVLYNQQVQISMRQVEEKPVPQGGLFSFRVTEKKKTWQFKRDEATSASEM